jgi:hypothetical protein
VALSNQTGGYYDLFALRHPEWMPRNCFEDYQSALQTLLEDKPVSRGKFSRLLLYVKSDQIKVQNVYSKMYKIPVTAQSVPVESGFGGFAIYKSDIFLTHDYGLDTKSFEGECEHITLSRKIRNSQFKIHIHPWLVNSHWNPYNLNRFAIIRHGRVIYKKIKKLTLGARKNS